MSLLDALRQPRRGQALVIMALGALVIMGALGLAIDAGYNFGQRRTLQNIADAAALRGALAVKNNADYLVGVSGKSPITTTYVDVVNVAKANGLADPTAPSAPTALTCSFVDNTGNPVVGCDIAVDTDADGSVIPDNATGVQVRVTERHPTFVMRALGITTSGTAATATAHVEVFSDEGARADSSPFVICGYNTFVMEKRGGRWQIKEKKSLLATYPSTDLTKAGWAKWTVESSGVGAEAKLNFDGNGGEAPYLSWSSNESGNEWFNIHDDRSDATGVALCGTQNAQGFKGVNDQAANVNVDNVDYPGVAMVYSTGATAGPVGDSVNVVNGCRKGDTNPDDCLMLIPIVDNRVVGDPSNKRANLIGYGWFWVKNAAGGNSSNHHIVKLADQVVVAGRSSRTLDPTKRYNALVIRLTR